MSTVPGVPIPDDDPRLPAMRQQLVDIINDRDADPPTDVHDWVDETARILLATADDALVLAAARRSVAAATIDWNATDPGIRNLALRVARASLSGMIYPPAGTA